MKFLLLALAACGADAATPDECGHLAGSPTTVGKIENLGTKELSGLAASHTIANVLYSHGDSNNPADVYAIDATTATLLQTMHVQDATNVDWEDIATAPCAAGQCIYVEDAGDNDLVRSNISIYEIVEPAMLAGSVSATRYDIVYPDGPHNVESLFVDPRDGKSYGIVKNDAKTAAVFEYPRTATMATAVQVATLTIPASDPRVTAADMSVDTCSARILIRTYKKLYEVTGAPTASVVDLLGSALATMPVADEDQGEAVAFAADGKAYFTTSEGSNPPLDRVSD